MDRPTILIVDDQRDNIDLIKTFFIKESYHLESASNGEEALKKVDSIHPDLILLDIVMPKMDGYQVCKKIKSNPETRLIPVVMVTGMNDRESKIKGINLGVDDFVTKPIDMFELKARVASLLRLKEYTDQLESAERIIFSLALAVEAKDPHTKGHCNRLANYASLLAEQIGLSDNEIRTVRRGGVLHDIGKLAIQDNILLKPGPLSEEEYEIVRTHSEAGERICKPLKTMEDVLPLIRHHQELYDGSGYPDHLKGEDIPLLARILALSDCYDALTTSRPYRDAMSHQEAIQILDQETLHGKYDPNLYAEFKTIVNMPEIHQRVNEDIREISELN